VRASRTDVPFVRARAATRPAPREVGGVDGEGAEVGGAVGEDVDHPQAPPAVHLDGREGGGAAGHALVEGRVDVEVGVGADGGGEGAGRGQGARVGRGPDRDPVERGVQVDQRVAVVVARSLFA
jgi:hypothetical protein